MLLFHIFWCYSTLLGVILLFFGVIPLFLGVISLYFGVIALFLGVISQFFVIIPHYFSVIQHIFAVISHFLVLLHSIQNEILTVASRTFNKYSCLHWSFYRETYQMQQAGRLAS